MKLAKRTNDRQERNAMICKDYERVNEYLRRQADNNTREIAILTLMGVYGLGRGVIIKILKEGINDQ